MFKFEVGGLYGAYDDAVPAVKVIKRTAKTVTVEDTDTGTVFTMRVKVYPNILDGETTEAATDSSVPAAWRECYTYAAAYKI
jgi:hypothetical protein